MSRPSLSHPDVLLATWFGSGYLPKAPGTWGSFAALPFGIGIGVWGGALALAVASVMIFFIGLWSAKGYMKRTGKHDPGAVVIDEVAGQWIAVIPISYLSLLTCSFMGLVWAALAFGLFRLFDIYKPWPVSWADNLDGAMGVMLDDVLAGLYAGLSLVGLAMVV